MEDIKYAILHADGGILITSHDPYGMTGGAFSRQIWTLRPTDRATAWKCLLEALALGCDLDRAKQLAEQWGCTPRDLVEYMLRTRLPSRQLQDGVQRYLADIAGVAPEEWFIWLASTPQNQRPDFHTMPRKDSQ